MKDVVWRRWSEVRTVHTNSEPLMIHAFELDFTYLTIVLQPPGGIPPRHMFS